MAEDRADVRDAEVRRLPRWVELFRGFQVALDPKKLLLAAAGLLVMSIGWWILAAGFLSARSPAPTFDSNTHQDWAQFKADRRKWDLLYEAAGNKPELTTPDDLAESRAEYEQLRQQYNAVDRSILDEILLGRREPYPLTATAENGVSRPVYIRSRPYGKLRVWPWSEYRGPNPYLLVTGREANPEEGTGRFGPWQRGQFVNWLLTEQVPVLLEPERKLLQPIFFLLHPGAGFWNHVYFALALVWMLATWALFGGAITRMAAVQIARREKVGMAEAIRFAWSRYLSYFSAPAFPLVFVLVIVVFCILFGFLHLIPGFGDIVVDGLGWPLIILAGLVMALSLVGLVGWPMMYATISAEGSDSFDALSRSYSYVYQSPWQYIWYCLVAVAYGAAVVFFVGFMGSLTAYLGKLGVAQTPGVERFNRDPSYLFVYAPTSFGWQDLLLKDATIGGRAVVPAGSGTVEPEAYTAYVAQLNWWNRVGATLVALWLHLLFLMVVGFGYSYFWSASTIIYLLMRRDVDDTDMDEVYLEEDDAEDSYGAPAPAAEGATTSLTMVEPPAMKTMVAPSGPATAPSIGPPGGGSVVPPA